MTQRRTSGDRDGTQDSRPLPTSARAYVYGVVALGMVPLGSSLIELTIHPPDSRWMLLALVTVLSGFIYIRVPSVLATVSVSDGFVFASVLLFGPAPATITVALDGFFASFRHRNRNLHRLLFNVAEPAISVWTAAHLFYVLLGDRPSLDSPASLGGVWIPILAMTTAYFALNGAFIATAVRLETGEPPRQFIREHITHVALNYVTTACLLLILVPNSSDLWLAALGAAVPLLVISYLSSHLSMDRLEEANRHLHELNRLYLSIVETFAVAVDAKDQVTHGHIRRVQAQALALAKALAITDETQLRAIEAAGLLHDLGKLVVPEHILNKPGALTSAELDQMKRHVTVGADMLSTIDFPYPVVPIVRHHHEAWDGSGYPDGLAGDAIPVGARILAVVDCYDALTSDRPYRRRLSHQEALSIIRARSGRMYDPRVVDAFTAIARQLPAPSVAVHEPRLTKAIAAEQSGHALADRAERLRHERALEREARSLSARLNNKASIEAIGKCLADYVTKVAGEHVCVLYTHDLDADRLTPTYISNELYQHLAAVSRALGAGISGWVGARQEPITNADAALDLEDLVAAVEPRFRTCLCVPLASRPAVLTIYSIDPRGFSSDQARLIGIAAADIALPPTAAVSPKRGVPTPHNALRRAVCQP